MHRVLAHTLTRQDLSVTVDAPGSDPDVLWRLYASPARWPDWSPHIRRVTTRGGAGELGVGDRVRIHGPPGVRLTAVVTLLDPPTRWDFRVGLPVGHRLEAAHEVLDGPAVRVRAWLRDPVPPAVGAALLTAYRPLATAALHRLVALAGELR